MEPSAIISAYRHSSSSDAISDLNQYFIFSPVIGIAGTLEDKNIGFRTEISETLLNDFSIADIKLIRELFRAELDCERAIRRHDNLYQLSFYLYSLGQMEDTFLLYEAKYGLKHMDASTMQDRYSITAGYEVEEMIKYVEGRFNADPKLKDDYPGLLEELQNIVDEPDYDSIADYSQFIRGYFFGHDDAINKQTPDLLAVKDLKKPWWKIW